MKIVVIIIILFVFVGLAVGLYFLLKPKDEEGSPVVDSPVVDSSVVPETETATLSATLSGCELDTGKTIKCEKGTIKTADIRYGRWDNTVCPHETVKSDTPAKENTYPMPDAVGKASWEIPVPVNEYVKEDPYPGVLKQWEVKYSCA